MTVKFRSLEAPEAYRYSAGTSFSGYIDISYAELVEQLGNGIGGSDDNKVEAQWVIQFGNGQIATIYNYKDGRNYMGLDGKDKEDIRDWHIGGRGQAVLKSVSELFPKSIVSK